MAAVTPTQIVTDLVATLQTLVPAVLVSADDGAPDHAPAQGPAAWVEWGPCSFELGNLEIRLHTVTVTVMTPRKGDYRGEQRIVRDAIDAVIVKLRTNVAVASEAIELTEASCTKPQASLYGGAEAEPVVASVLSLVYETLDDVTNQIAL